jgi:uncharacterized phosphosugar-binding protein
MSKETKEYLKIALDIFSKIEEQAEGPINEAAELMAESILDDKLVHIIGTGGHSNMAAMELLWRAGTLAPVNAILDPGIAVINGAKHSNIMERTPEYAKSVLNSYDLKEGEVLIIANAYGINTMTIDTALYAKEKGLKTIGLTSTSFANHVNKDHPSRHPSGKNLHEIVNIFVDNHLPLGDAVIKFPDFQQKVAPTSTLCNSFALNLMVIKTVEKILAKGENPPVWMSANMPGGDEANKKYEEKYAFRIKHL